MSIRRVFAVITAFAITGAFLLGLSEAASGAPRWVTREAAPIAAEYSDNLTGENA